MGSRRKTGLAIVALLLLLAAVVRPLRDTLWTPVVRHAQALVNGRPLKGFPPDQLAGYEASLSRRKLETWSARLQARDPAEQARLDARLAALEVQQAQVVQEKIWYHVVHHPLESAGVLLFAGGVLAALWWFGAAGVRTGDRRRSVSTPQKRRRPRTGRVRPRAFRAGGESETGMAANSGDVPGGDILEPPPEAEVERLFRDADGSVSDAPVAQALDQWDGWSQAVRDRVPPLEMAHLIALFASDPSRNYLGLIGFLSHQLALSGSDHIRLLPGRKGVQVFLSTPDREQEIGELPSHQYASLVAALTTSLDIQPGGPTARSSRQARLLTPSEEGYQLQEIRLYDNGIEIKALEHVRFLPAGW